MLGVMEGRIDPRVEPAFHRHPAFGCKDEEVRGWWWDAGW